MSLLSKDWTNWKLKWLCTGGPVYGENIPASAYVPQGLRFIRTTDIDGASGQLLEEGVFVSPDAVSETLADGDLLLSRSGTIGRSFLYDLSSHGPCAFAGYLIRFRPKEPYLRRFLFWFTKSDGFLDQVKSAAVESTISNFNGQRYAEVEVPVPFEPFRAQAIAAFLDRETAKIDALVAEQERLLVLLEEKRQTGIANAVTRGLDPTVPMKDSGVEWLGQVPAHWSVATTNVLKAPASTITYGIVQAGPDIEGGIPYVRTSDMRGTELPLTGYLRTTPEIAAAYERSSIKAGDLVIAIRASIGKTLIVPPELAGGNLTQGTAKIEPGRNILGKFLCYVLNSVPCQQHFASIAKGTTFKEITLEMLRKLKVPQPSSAEQQRIVEYLAGVLPSIGQLISEAEIARGLLHERRAALISAAVTGKLDVRAPAPATGPALAAE
ncbi:restriction endonuclease subunit S [Lichenicoccus roseus]|uniref:Type I restriction modification DNA specificity domain-containing protein n=1 Tax=Lichenicoccus roseus TaxID=2683649 RepID=A0A5R9J4S7_9PROT|nr:restriction endonuclease subunit S [Lichenicoccus roseus]TLU70621.1 hypothetical protein FE263_20710 [Lichenicoccus roseus]